MKDFLPGLICGILIGIGILIGYSIGFSIGSFVSEFLVSMFSEDESVLLTKDFKYAISVGVIVGGFLGFLLYINIVRKNNNHGV